MQCPLCNRSIIRLTSVPMPDSDFNLGQQVIEWLRKKTKIRKNAASHAAHASRKPLRLHGSIAREIGLLIVSGRYRPGHVLDGEVEASEQRRVSRTAYREAVRILAAKGLVHSRPRVGTRVSALEDWHLLDPDVLVLGVCGRTGARGPAWTVRAAQHRRAGCGRAGRDAPQSAAPRQHAARARCDERTHAARAGRAPGRQGISRRVAARPPPIPSSCRSPTA